MVADGNRRGYRHLLDAFWDECASHHVLLPTERPVSAPAFCQARSKLSSGRGNVVAQMETLQKLGAKASKRLAKDLRAEADAEDLADDPPPALEPPESN